TEWLSRDWDYSAVAGGCIASRGALAACLQRAGLSGLWLCLFGRPPGALPPFPQADGFDRTDCKTHNFGLPPLATPSQRPMFGRWNRVLGARLIPCTSPVSNR